MVVLAVGVSESGYGQAPGHAEDRTRRSRKDNKSACGTCGGGGRLGRRRQWDKPGAKRIRYMRSGPAAAVALIAFAGSAPAFVAYVSGSARPDADLIRSA